MVEQVIPDAGKLVELAERVLSGTGADNALDVLIEVALFEPDRGAVAVRANHAGTKVIYTNSIGTDATCWAPDWTLNRLKAATELRARAASSDTAMSEGEV